MTKFKANEDTRIWCEYCRVFVFNNRINREKHDNSPQHQANFKKKVETLRREELEKEKILGSLSRDLKSTSSRSFYENNKGIKSLNLESDEKSLSNMLNLKQSQSQSQSKEDSVISKDRKLIPGLAISTKPKPNQSEKVSSSIKTIETEDFNDKLRRVPISDIKSTTSELKRKMFEDEKKLLSVSNVDGDFLCSLELEREREHENEHEHEHEHEHEREREHEHEHEHEIQPDISSLFKKKKTNTK